jgi:hypothetical protein
MRLELGPGPGLVVWSWLDGVDAADGTVYRVVGRVTGDGGYRVAGGIVKVQLTPEGTALVAGATLEQLEPPAVPIPGAH